MSNEIVGKALKLIFIDGEPSNEDKELIQTIADLVNGTILAKIKARIPETTTIPIDLNHVAVEMIVRRYNRLGSEGMSQESVEGHTATYRADDKDLMDLVDDWIDVNEDPSTTRKVIRFL